MTPTRLREIAQQLVNAEMAEELRVHAAKMGPHIVPKVSVAAAG